MFRAATILLLAMAMLLPSGARADGLSATATLSVTILPTPLAATLLPGCQFTVSPTTETATCRATLLVSSPTPSAFGWRVTLAAAKVTCGCGQTLPTKSLVIDGSDEVVFVNGQPVDTVGGPRFPTASMKRSLAKSRPVLLARPTYGNGAYSVTMVIRLNVPKHAGAGVYVPTWTIGLVQETT